MTKIKDKDFKAAFQIKSIELLNGSLNLPANPNIPISNFNFNVNLEKRTDALNKLVFVIVHVEIKDADYALILGTLSVSCIFVIPNFEQVIDIEKDGKVNIPKNLIEVLNANSISTTRGVMFSTFKGTFLHDAVLPIIDSKQFEEIS